MTRPAAGKDSGSKKKAPALVFGFRVAQLDFDVELPLEFLASAEHLTHQYRSSRPTRYHLRIKSKVPRGQPIQFFHSFHPRSRAAIAIQRWQKGFVELIALDPSVASISAALGSILINVLSYNQGVLLHSALLSTRWGGFLFVGRSGAGKSTVAWNASRSSCLHEDRVAIRKIGGKWRAFGVPLCDNNGLPGINESVQLRKVFILKKAKQSSANRLSSLETLRRLVPNVFLPIKEHSSSTRTLSTLMDLVKEVPCDELCFTKDFDFGKWMKIHEH